MIIQTLPLMPDYRWRRLRVVMILALVPWGCIAAAILWVFS